MQILHCVDRYLASRSGDVKKLKPPRTGFPPPLWRLPRVLRSEKRHYYHDHRRPSPPRSLPLTCASGRLECGFRLLPDVVLDCLALRLRLVLLFNAWLLGRFENVFFRTLALAVEQLLG
jgi:hypothetical protein